MVYVNFECFFFIYVSSLGLEPMETFFAVDVKHDKKRSRTYAKPGWSPVNKLNSFIWKKTKIPCAWTFKQANVRKDDVIVKGKCVDPVCKAVIVATSRSQSINIDIGNYDGAIQHMSKKRKVRFDYKEKIENMVMNKSAYVAHKHLADQLMEENDAEPAHLPTI